jgi:hypothetical protein
MLSTKSETMSKSELAKFKTLPCLGNNGFRRVSADTKTCPSTWFGFAHHRLLRTCGSPLKLRLLASYACLLADGGNFTKMSEKSQQKKGQNAACLSGVGGCLGGAVGPT